MTFGGDIMKVLRSVEHIVESTILASRWILAVFCLGIAFALALYALSFVRELFHISTHLYEMKETEIILAMLSLIDAALVASLMVMVMISSYENFISQFDEHKTELAWLGTIGTGSLKIKIASAIVAISSIHLLRVFLNASEYPNDKILYAMLLHITFIVSALCLGWLEVIVGYNKPSVQDATPANQIPTPH
jgi:uncharacterized protein (TIGR00645 family)